ncbi:LysR family transcriptional regulator [Acerihabitans sp. TG2]|uniref:LysR family transcriptional regulator n=1 Tax=Acerihabitans sp. TG2 TaxID=3096008 RepID=UPI002B231281|nr:LysR family transcriptional regulator [Acerihabitans sp. TG2]MEA9392375.1 LysR family transcriptional regulator [Acerihabitans sp. TG2]
MNWDNTRFLLAIARTGSLRAAATSLEVDQATVARRLRTLEQELQTRLFTRQPEGYTLTTAGQLLLPEAETMEAAAAAMRRKTLGMDTSLAGTVHIASTESLASCFLLPALAKLRQSHPDITVMLSTAPALVDIKHGETDLAVRSARPIDENLIIRRLTTFHIGLYASADYVARRGLPVSGNAFSGHDLIMFPRDAVPQYWQRLCDEPITNGNIVLETPSQWLLIESIRHGVGISMMAREIVERLCPELVNVMPARQEKVDIWLVANPEVWSAGRVRVVMDAISHAFM